MLDVDELDIAIVGEVPQGLPPLGLPDVGLDDYVDLLLPAVALSLIVFADGIATVRTFALKHGYDVDANAELRGFGAASVLAGGSSALPVSGSGSRTAVNDDSGGRTQVMGLTAAVVVALFLLFLMPLIEPLPKAALGVIVVVAALGLFNVRSIWRLRRIRPAEVGLAVSAFIGVLVLGVVGGIVVAIGLSIGMFLYRVARPHDAVLGKVEDVDGYHDIEQWEDAQTRPGVIVYRFDAALFFVNAEYMRQRVLALVDAGDDVEWLDPQRRGLDLSRRHGHRHARATALRACRPRRDGRRRPSQGTATGNLPGDGAHGEDRCGPVLPDRALGSRCVREPSALPPSDLSPSGRRAGRAATQQAATQGALSGTDKRSDQRELACPRESILP